MNSLSHGPSLETVQTLIHNSESILCSSSPQPVSHLQCMKCATYLSITSFLQLQSLVFTHASYFLDTHLHSLGNLPSFHGLTQHCSFHSQYIFSHQLYQFLNTISIHPTFSAYGCIATNSSLTISLSKLFPLPLTQFTTNTRLESHTANGNMASYFTYPGFRVLVRPWV